MYNNLLLYYIVLLLSIAFYDGTFIYTYQHATINANKPVRLRSRVIQTNQAFKVDEYSLNKMQDDEGDLKLPKEFPVLDTLISSEGDKDLSESINSKLEDSSSRSNIYHKNNNDNRKNKMNGQRLPKDSSLLDSYWPNSNVGNIFDIGWDPNPPKESK
uniref:Putative netrin receptor unc5 n=1 Tax=Schistosoma mansoni TaxID=6183 RepID=A0A5K4EUD7_SCHMA